MNRGLACLLPCVVLACAVGTEDPPAAGQPSASTPTQFEPGGPAATGDAGARASGPAPASSVSARPMAPPTASDCADDVESGAGNGAGKGSGAGGGKGDGTGDRNGKRDEDRDEKPATRKRNICGSVGPEGASFAFDVKEGRSFSLELTGAGVTALVEGKDIAPVALLDQQRLRFVPMRDGTIQATVRAPGGTRPFILTRE